MVLQLLRRQSSLSIQLCKGITVIVFTRQASPHCLITFTQISIFIEDRVIIISVRNYADYVSSETCEGKAYVTSETI